MIQNNLRWFVTLPNLTSQQSNIIEAEIRNNKRRTYLTLITNSQGVHNQVLIGIIKLNNPHSLI
jgi:hypothetical protein